MSRVKIEQWSTGTYGDNWTAPELAGICLRGEVYGHPKKQDGTLVKTSRVVSVSGRIVHTTYTEYELGEPDPEFLNWLKDEGRVYDPVNPIKMVK